MLRRALPTLAAFSLVAATVLGATASSAQAAVVANQFTVTPTTITAGDSVSISASFRIAPPARHNQVVTIHLTSPTTGTVSPTVASHTGFSSCIALATTIECHFPSGAGNGAVGTVNATVATSADATGTFNASATYVDSHTASTLIAGPTTVTIRPTRARK